MFFGVPLVPLRNRIAPICAVAAGCAFVAWLPILKEGVFGRQDAEEFFEFSAILIGSAGFGGLVAGSIFVPLFGLPRWTGWVASTALGLIAIAVAASIAGVIMMHSIAIIDGNRDVLDQTYFGVAGFTIGLLYLFQLAQTLFGLATIAVYIALAHLVARRSRLRG